MTLWLVGRENRTGTSVSMIIEGEVVEWSLYISITCSQTLHYTSTRSDKHIPRWLQTLGQWHVASFIEATILLPEKLCSATRFSSYRLRLARNCVLLSWKRPKIKSSFLQIVSYPQSSCGLSHTLISPPLVSVQIPPVSMQVSIFTNEGTGMAWHLSNCLIGLANNMSHE